MFYNKGCNKAMARDGALSYLKCNKMHWIWHHEDFDILIYKLSIAKNKIKFKFFIEDLPLSCSVSIVSLSDACYPH